MYNNPNLNIIVMSPGRTGSNLIVSFLAKVGGVTPYIRRHDNNQTQMKPKEILHSHDPEDVKLGNADTQYILSTRNLIDCTFSRLIGWKSKIWQNYTYRQLHVEPFYTTSVEFLSCYNYSIKYYNGLKPLLPAVYQRIDYSEFCDDETNLLNILNLSNMSYRFRNKIEIPIKTIGSYSEWIKNYDEILEFSKTLSAEVPI